MLCAAPWAVGWYMATAIGGKVQEVRELLTLRTTLHQALERDCEHSTAEQLEKEPLDCHNRVLCENARQRRSEHPYADSSHQQATSSAAFRRWQTQVEQYSRCDNRSQIPEEDQGRQRLADRPGACPYSPECGSSAASGDQSCAQCQCVHPAPLCYAQQTGSHRTRQSPPGFHESVIKTSGLWYYDGKYGFLMRRSISRRNVSAPLSDAGCD
jgi:hypothetical protein